MEKERKTRVKRKHALGIIVKAREEEDENKDKY